MADPKEPRKMTSADAAKCVKRTVTELVETKDADGKPGKKAVTKEVAVTAKEVLAFRDYGTHVVVVTRDGQKLTGSVAE